MKVPVVSVEGRPLMPSTPGRARRLLRDGLARPKRNKLGLFYIQMTAEAGDETQLMALSVDPGAKYDGVAVASDKEVELKGMVFLPVGVPKKMETRKNLRRARRFRNCPRRQQRFNNRKRNIGWLAPTQRSKIECRLKVAREICAIYPITAIITEDVRFNHAASKDGRYFSTVEIGKKKTYDEYEKLAALVRVEVSDTDGWRKEFGLSKHTEEKWRQIPETHANDSVAMLMGITGCQNADTPLMVWWRLQYARRSLHRQTFQKGGLRPKFGGTTNGGFLRKGDWVEGVRGGAIYKGWVCGLPTDRTNMIGIADADGSRIGQFTPEKVKLLKRNGGFSWNKAA